MKLLIERADVERFRSIVLQQFGLHYDDAKLDFLADVLRQRMLALKIPQLDAYLEHIHSNAERIAELRALAEQLTVTETFFFRNADNFRALVERILPERIKLNSAEKKLRILSAGCASGEEPYSLAILVREALPDLASWDVTIAAIDLNPAMLKKAAGGRYSKWSLRATSEESTRRYFQEIGSDFVLDPAVRAMVTFEERNLMDDDPRFWRTSSFDVVFCRNVLMYFTPEIMSTVVLRLRRVLRPNGYLFLGHAETLRGLSHGFRLCHTHDTFYYQRSDEPESSLGTSVPLGERAQVTPSTFPTAMFQIHSSWMEVIQQASDRIATLTADRSPPPAQVRPISEAARAPAVAAPPPRLWDLSLILEAMRQERFSDALDLLFALPVDSLDEPDALILRAALLTNSSRLNEAEEACRRLLELDELNAGAHYLMALCREHAGDAAGTVEHDQTAIYLDATFAMPHLHLGLAARRAGDLPTAQRELGQALVLLAREDASRLLLFGGGFSREMLLHLCRVELRAAGGDV